jgi:hypothetical protein
MPEARRENWTRLRQVNEMRIGRKYGRIEGAFEGFGALRPKEIKLRDKMA